jgi:hypothetical protein
VVQGFKIASVRERSTNMLSTIIGVLILVADIWAILSVFGSATTTGKKVLWIVIILILPVVGLIVWYLAGPKKT